MKDGGSVHCVYSVLNLKSVALEYSTIRSCCRDSFMKIAKPEITADIYCSTTVCDWVSEGMDCTQV
jgi:hypothetical protein